MAILDGLRARGNRRDIDKVKSELKVTDAADASAREVEQVLNAGAADSEPEARQVLADAKAYEREVDIAESDSDDPDAPERRSRYAEKDDGNETPLDGRE